MINKWEPLKTSGFRGNFEKRVVKPLICGLYNSQAPSKNCQRRFLEVSKCKWVLVSALFLIFLAACSQEPIFYSIQHEIKLKEPSIRNVVYSVLEFPYASGTLYAANGRINTKQNGSGNWNRISDPGFTVRLASDSSGMYALTQKTEEEHTVYSVYYSADAGSTWQILSGISNVITIFDNQTDDANRKAYVVVDADGRKVYELNGITVPTTAETLASDITAPIAAVYLKGSVNKTIFSNNQGIVANTTGNRLYRLNGSTAQHSSDGVTWTGDVGGLSSGSHSSAVALYEKDSSTTYLLAGTTAGARAIKIDLASGSFDGGFMELSNAGLGSNAASALNSAYILSGGLFVCKTGGDNILYASSVNRLYAERSGLWAYYASTGVWNRE